ncbi:SDR family NAD(P)-dependent oxidoreductase [Microlunatus sp. GCM10028923]|uniref:SDR family NAD(P)-dependent oxidoreductase n=1 Tax=Microlunatus sp. GCM10028923 TaxID=3273400 RepID=UPI0036176264
MITAAPLAGRVVLITGASRGIGAAVAAGLAARGARVIIGYEPRADRATEAAAVQTKITEAGGTAITLPADLSDPAQVAELVRRSGEAWDRLDVVIANAAASGRVDWRTLSVADWDRVQQVNVRGTFLLAQQSHPWLLRAAAPSFVAVTSVMAETGQPGAVHYTASKAAIIGLVRALARELGPDGIRVNAVMPGAIRTEDELDQFPDPATIDPEILAVQAVPRRGLATDLVGAFAFLAGDDSAFVTGQVINVDGGWVLR